MSNPRAKVQLIGGLTKKPEVVADGKIAKFSLGVGGAGKTFSDSGFFDVVVFRSEGDKDIEFLWSQITGDKLDKGSQIILDGSLRHEVFEVEGNKRSKVVVVADAFTYLSTGKKPEGEASESSEEVKAEATGGEQSSGGVVGKF